MNNDQIFENVVNYIADLVQNDENLSVLLNDEETNIVSDVLSMALKLSLARLVDKVPEEEYDTLKAMLQDKDTDIFAFINRISVYVPDFEDELKQDAREVLAQMSDIMDQEDVITEK